MNTWSLKLNHSCIKKALLKCANTVFSFHVRHFLYMTSLKPHIWPFRQRLEVLLYICRNKVSKLTIVHTANKQRHQVEIPDVTPCPSCCQLHDMACWSSFLWFFNRVSKTMLYSSMDLWASYKVSLLQIFCLPACLTCRIKVLREPQSCEKPQAALLIVFRQHLLATWVQSSEAGSRHKAENEETV